MQSRARAVGGIDETAIVDLDVVGLNHLDACRSDFRIAVRMADAVRTEGHRVLVRRWNEISNLFHGKWIPDIEDTSPGVEPREDGKLAVVRGIERLVAGVIPETPSPAAKISRIFGYVESRKRPRRRLVRDVQQETEMRGGTVSAGTRPAVLPPSLFGSHDHEVAALERRMALETGNRHAIY